METSNTNQLEMDEYDESLALTRRIRRLSLHLTPPICNSQHQLQMLSCARAKLNVDSASLSHYLRGKHRDIQERIFEYFNSRPHLQTPIEISKDDHRQLCMNQLLALVRDAGIRPFRYVVDDPAKYFAILEAVGSIDISLGIKMGVQYRCRPFAFPLFFF